MMQDTPQILSNALQKYTSYVFGDYFNTALLIIFGAIFAVVVSFVPKRQKMNAILFAGVLFIFASSPLINIGIFFLTVAVLYSCSNYRFFMRGTVFWTAEIFLMLSTVIIYKIFGEFSAFFSFAAYYTAYRTIHYYVDISQNPSIKIKFIPYLRYLFFFPSFSHGPIERLENFLIDDVNKEHIFFGIKRILTGTLKFISIVYIFSKIPASDFSFGKFYMWLFFTAYAGAIKLYLLFSGDVDIVIGIASLMGVKLSENFPKFPYIQTSLTKFWQNWQSTVVSFLTAYVYFPLCRNRKRIYLKTMVIIMIIGWAHLFYNTKEFPTLAGVIYYTLWGIFLGGIFAFSKYFEKKKSDKRKILEAKYPRFASFFYSESKAMSALSAFFTFTIIAVGWTSPLYLIIVHFI